MPNRIAELREMVNSPLLREKGLFTFVNKALAPAALTAGALMTSDSDDDNLENIAKWNIVGLPAGNFLAQVADKESRLNDWMPSPIRNYIEGRHNYSDTEKNILKARKVLSHPVGMLGAGALAGLGLNAIYSAVSAPIKHKGYLEEYTSNIPEATIAGVVGTPMATVGVPILARSAYSGLKNLYTSNAVKKLLFGRTLSGGIDPKWMVLKKYIR